MRSRASLLLLLILACEGAEAEPTPPRRAAEFRSDVVDAALEQGSELVRTRGFQELGEPWRGFLVDRGSDVDQVSLRSGSCYVVLGVASEAVRSLELALYDSDGAEVDRQVAARDAERAELGASALHYCPPRSGTYFVAVRSVGSGLFAVRRFEGPTGLDVRLEGLLLRREGTAPKNGEPEAR